MGDVAVISHGENRLAFMPAVRGLVSEGERVRRAVEEHSPEAIALTIGREDLSALEAYDGSVFPPENWEEDLYVAGLSAWGQVRKPPPCFVEAVRAAKERDLALRALDFNDEDYTETYVQLISTWDLFGHTRLEKKARNHAFAATTPEEFVMEFDDLVNEPQGYIALEKARERHIASRLAKLMRKHQLLLAVVEYERAAGVRALIEATVH